MIFAFSMMLPAYLWVPVQVNAQPASGYEQAQSGGSLNIGVTYDPSEDDISFLQFSLFKLYDYDAIWKHNAPDNLRFKIEGAVGCAYVHENDARLVVNIGIMALLYLDNFESKSYLPFLEAGIGGIFTDFQVAGQDYHFNFNPQAGIGIEFKRDHAPNRFLTVRVHHVSNGGIGSTNRGLNSISILFGQFF